MSISDRRSFLKTSLKLTAGLVVAFNFGCSLRSKIDRQGAKRVAVLYASRYGATADTAGWIAEGIGGDVALVDIAQHDSASVLAEHDLLIVGSGVWTGGPHPDIRNFSRDYAEQLSEKLLAVFVVCGTEPTSDSARKRIDGYLQQITQALKQAPLFTAQFGGRVVVEKLNNEDRAALNKFYRTYLNKELESWNRTSPEEATLFGDKLQGAMQDERG